MDKQKYLIVKFTASADGWRCEKPLGITDDISMWSKVSGYEVHKIKPDGSLERIKDYYEGDLYITKDNCSNYYIVNEKNSCLLPSEMKALFK